MRPWVWMVEIMLIIVRMLACIAGQMDLVAVHTAGQLVLGVPGHTSTARHQAACGPAAWYAAGRLRSSVLRSVCLR